MVRFTANAFSARSVLVGLAWLFGNTEVAWAEETRKEEAVKPIFTFGAYAEALYQWNFNRPPFEYRQDHAAGNMFFGDKVTGNGSNAPLIPDRKAQDTLTEGATTWF